MMPAEKWYEHQVNYQKYGLDMGPGKATKTKETGKPQKSVIGAKDKARLLWLTIFTGMLCICLIVMAAYSAKIKYNINGILAETDRVQGEIENLNVAIKTASSISVIEEKAQTELGMVYPEVDQITYLRADSNQMKDFALALKRIAYNQ